MDTWTVPFGFLSDGTAVTAYVLDNGTLRMTVLDYGGTIQSLLVPNRAGTHTDVVLGYDSASEYEHNDAFLGAIIGRFGNRIGGGAFELGGRRYTLAKNDGENTLHGGLKGFDKQMWDCTFEANGICCSRLSPDGEEGFPGNLRVKVHYLLEGSALRIRYEAVCDADTIISLTNHSYFNLAGGGTALDHGLELNAGSFLENDSGCLPTGRILSVEGTPFDFRVMKPLGRDIGTEDAQLAAGHGYDHCFCLCGGEAARVRSEKSGIEMRMSTDRPGVQLYSANWLTKRRGKGGMTMNIRDALCLETQGYPAAPNYPAFPPAVLRAGEEWISETSYVFGLC